MVNLTSQVCANYGSCLQSIAPIGANQADIRVDKPAQRMYCSPFQGVDMIRSMTGYGQAETVRDGVKISVELSSLNNRFFETQIRLPRMLSRLEPKIRELISSKVKRGKVLCFVNRVAEEPEPVKLIVNEGSAEEYIRALRALKKRFSLQGDVEVSDLINLEGVFEPDEQVGGTELDVSLVEETVSVALDELISMRVSEGEKLAQDMRPRLKKITDTVGRIEKLSDESVEQYKQKLEVRIRELLDEVIDPGERVAMEAAIVAERCDVTEECVRIRSHGKQFLDTIEKDGPVGKRLNFLLQELNREANTIGSKSIAYEISSESVLLKEEIEKLREQIQNIE